jgi:hypothetical protein
VQPALRANSFGHDYRSGSSASTSRVNKFLTAGVTAAGVAAIALNPVAPTIAADVQHKAAVEIQERAVRLTSGIGDVLGDYTSVVTQAGANLQTLGAEAAALPALLQQIGASLSGAATGLQASANLQTVVAAVAALPALLQQLGANLPGYGNLISTGLTGGEAGLQNALYGGWFGGDDGFVFGLFGGTVTANGVTESGSTLQEILGALAKGNTFDAFSFADEWALEVVDHTLKPLLSPFLSTAKVGATPSATIPGEILQTLTALAATLPTPFPSQVLQSLTNLDATFLNYSSLKAVANALVSPMLSVAFGLVDDLSKIGTDVSSANIAGAVTDALKLPADLTGDLINGYVFNSAQFNPTNLPFTGLLNAGSLLDDALSTWPKEIAAALAPLTATAATTATTTTTTAAHATTPAAAALLAAIAKATKTKVAPTATTADAAGSDTTAAKTTVGPRHAWRSKIATGTKAADSSTGSKDAVASPRHRAARRSDAGTTSKKDAGGSHGQGKHASHSSSHN